MYIAYVRVISQAELMGKTIAAAEFQAKCLRLINEMGEDGEPVTITDRGRLVA